MKRLHRRLAVLLAALGTGVAVVFGAGLAHADVPVQLHSFVNVNSGKCLEIGYFSTANYASANQYTCLNGDNQLWGIGRVKWVGATGYWQIQNVHSLKCLAVDVGGQNFSPVFQTTCNIYAADNTQLWQFVPPGCYQRGFISYCTAGEMLKNLSTGRCLEILNYSTADFAAADEYDCYGGSTQEWNDKPFDTYGTPPP